MGIKIGNIDASYFKVGSSDCSIYLGTTLLYSGGTTPPTPPPTPAYSAQPLTFVAEEDGTFSYSVLDENPSYSLDSGTTWQEYNDGDTISLLSGQTVMWKGQLTAVNVFSSSGRFHVEGNIMSLLFDDNFVGQTDLTNYNSVFYSSFYGATGLTSAENLILPATTLAQNCYNSMFNGCTNLTTAPELLATTLVSNCYQYMFKGCTSLTTAPELPATTLTESCYRYMFSGCTSLTTAPELPATTLTERCYEHMFEGCTSLTTAPELPATTLERYCYNLMFASCTSLSSVTCLATNISASRCTSSWLAHVAANGTFTKAASMTSWTTGNNGIPNGWTVVDAS